MRTVPVTVLVFLVVPLLIPRIVLAVSVSFSIVQVHRFSVTDCFFNLRLFSVCSAVVPKRNI